MVNLRSRSGTDEAPIKGLRFQLGCRFWPADAWSYPLKVDRSAIRFAVGIKIPFLVLTNPALAGSFIRTAEVTEGRGSWRLLLEVGGTVLAALKQRYKHSLVLSSAIFPVRRFSLISCVFL